MRPKRNPLIKHHTIQLVGMHYYGNNRKITLITTFGAVTYRNIVVTIKIDQSENEDLGTCWSRSTSRQLSSALSCIIPMPRQKDEKLHSHWNLLKDDPNPKKVREFLIKTDFKATIRLQALRKELHRQCHPPQRSFGEMQNVSKGWQEDRCEGESTSHRSPCRIRKALARPDRFPSPFKLSKSRFGYPSRDVVFHGQSSVHHVRKFVCESLFASFESCIQASFQKCNFWTSP